MIAEAKILILEDDKSDADLLCRELKKSGLVFRSEVVQTKLTFEKALEQFRPDIIISDYSLPSFDAVTAFRIKQNTYPLIPFIIVSGTIGEENAVELIKEGVTDYASKGKLFALSVKIERALKEAEEKKEKVIIDEKLRVQTAEIRSVNAELLQLNQELESRVVERTKALTESEHRFRNMMETIPQIAWTNTLEGEFIFYNRRWYDYTGLSTEQIVATGLLTAIHPDDLEKSTG